MDLRAHAKKLKIALLIAALMLCVGIFPGLPRAFFILLKWAVCGAAVYGALSFKDEPGLGKHFLPLVLLALAFNPLVPVALTPLIWLLVDLGAAIYF